ncbi:hypothetical protein [Metapseudomonas otitidis]|uniref:hypothetical protein n=1 Tax=Metapseudomonas otitidis TaxID=319939 RepID=UPI003CF90B61
MLPLRFSYPNAQGATREWAPILYSPVNRLLYLALWLVLPFAPMVVLADEAALQRHCLQEWPNDGEMRAYCVSEQRKAARILAGYSGANRQRCEAKWLPDFEMALHCTKEQNASQASVARALQDEIAARCAREWPGEYDMQEHCAKQRRAAKENIERNYSGAIRQACEREWGTEYEMVEHCIEEGE